MNKKGIFLVLLLMLGMLFGLPGSMFAQKHVVTGTVVDQNGEPMVAVTVMEKGTSNGTITNFDGVFSLSVANNATLSVSFVGFKTQETSTTGKSNVRIVLREDNEQLDEIVVVGYGTMKKSDLTGAITRVGEKELQSRPVNNAFEALQGKAAGVDITTNERPGQIGSIRIRGERSLNGGNTPLYVVDGVPLMSASGIETLNPRDIESIDILKDASATAIYGSRGANGVVIVTTKQGQSGKMAIDYTGTLTVSNIIDRSPSMSAADFIQFSRWAKHNADPSAYADPMKPTQAEDAALFGETASLDPTFYNNVMNGWSGNTWDASKVKNTNWTDYVTQTALSQEHTLAVSGGTDKMKAYASFGYLNNKGTQKGQWYERYTGKVNVNIQPTKWFTLQASINGTWSEMDYGMSTFQGRSGSVPDAIYGTAKTIFNYALPYDENGDRIINPGGQSTVYNIMEEWNHSTQKSQSFRALGNFSGTIDFGEILEPLKGLRYKLAFGPDFRHWREGAYVDGFSTHKINSNGTEGNNYSRLQNRRDFSWTLDNMIMFDRTFAEKHKVGVTLLQTASKWNIENSSMSANKIEKDSYLWNAFNTVDVTNSDQAVSIGSGLVERQLESYMIRLNYGFNERYLITASGRWDGASQLADGHKWDFFPSTALAWRASEEEFIKNINWISNLKVRLGVGVTGNAAVSPYETKGDITSIFLPFNGMGNVIGYTTNEPYYTNSQLAMANPELGWEKTTQWNLGLDFGFLNSRIWGSLEFYWSRTNDVIMQTNIPTLTGFPFTYANVGKTKNHGVEITLNALPVKLSNGFKWETSFNAAYQKDEIVELAYGKNDMPDNSLFIGESLSVFYGFGNKGIWQDTAEDKAEMAKWAEKGFNFRPGNVRPEDVNGDYEMTIEDRKVLGNRNPKWTLGWTNTFSFKGIELGISMFGRLGYMFSTGGEPLTATANQREVDYWTPYNTGAEYQMPIYAQSTSGSGDNYSSLLGFKKASFIKVRNISLGYNLPKNIIKPIGLTHVKAYAQVINPFSLKQSIDGFDLDTGRTYFNRSFVFGLEVGF